MLHKTHKKTTKKVTHTSAHRKVATVVHKKALARKLLTTQTAQFSSDADTAASGIPPSKRKSPIFDFVNQYANDAKVEEDVEKIDKFLTPLGLGDYKDKFTSFEQVVMTGSPILKRDFGMNVKERRLLRRKANHYRVGHYYKTGEIFTAKYPSRQPVSPRRYHRDETSDDETSFILPAKDGIYRAHLRYPGATFTENKLMRTYEEDMMFKRNNRDNKNDVLPPHMEAEVRKYYEENQYPIDRILNKNGQIPVRKVIDAINNV